MIFQNNNNCVVIFTLSFMLMEKDTVVVLVIYLLCLHAILLRFANFPFLFFMFSPSSVYAIMVGVLLF